MSPLSTHTAHLGDVLSGYSDRTVAFVAAARAKSTNGDASEIVDLRTMPGVRPLRPSGAGKLIGKSLSGVTYRDSL